ncbi:MAG TPA: TIGR03564 family F420-dependent LLM class oxidoreductase [Amycolatopsis sp.]|nr:TIGR03564 family F420-dependent LLM class oxidoreductase [Amycolatopsis sp.]
MTIGVALAETGPDNYVDAIVDKARTAAESGLKSVWFGQRSDYDSPGLAALVGREVQGLHVGTAAIPVAGRQPLVVAAQAQTAQAATHGRYHLGIAVGHALGAESFGVPFERPIARLREFLSALRSILETGKADYRGELFTAATPLPTALPGAEPTVPVLVAAMAPQALRVSAELADGILPFLAGPKTLGEHLVPAVSRNAVRQQRIVAFVSGVVTSDVDGARENALRRLAFYDRFPSYQRVVTLEGAARAAELAVIGDEETVAAEVKRYFEAGATEVVFSSTDLAGEADQVRTLRLLGELVS